MYRSWVRTHPACPGAKRSVSLKLVPSHPSTQDACVPRDIFSVCGGRYATCMLLRLFECLPASSGITRRPSFQPIETREIRFDPGPKQDGREQVRNRCDDDQRIVDRLIVIKYEIGHHRDGCRTYAQS